MRRYSTGSASTPSRCIYMGRQTLQPFLSRADKGCIILCRTSNPATTSEELLVINEAAPSRSCAARVRDNWNARANCMLVVGATQPDALRQVRAIVGTLTILLYRGRRAGWQRTGCRHRRDQCWRQAIVNASRSVIFRRRSCRRSPRSPRRNQPPPLL
ncbi:MAG: hypothetical protein U0521_24950 [Anaerolineae bacterium]